MLKKVFQIIIFLIAISFVSISASAQKVTEPGNTPPEWSKPFQPFRIVGNLYYVGTYELACYLITTTQGNILINTGLAASVPLIKANVEALGFKFKDIKILLTMQAHYDHMGAMAAIKQLTGAKMMIDEKDLGVMEDGGSSDYALGGNGSTYVPVKANRLLHNGDTIKLGDIKLVMLHHPGHTKGSCSFLFDVEDDQRYYRILIANMPTIVTEKSFSNVPGYADISKDYSYTLNAMKKLSFDIWLSSHASQFKLHDKHKPGDAYNPAAFIDRKGYDATIDSLQEQFAKKVESNR